MTEPNFWQILIPGVEVYFRSWHQQDHSQAGGHRVDPRHPHLRRKGDFLNIFDTDHHDHRHCFRIVTICHLN